MTRALLLNASMEPLAPVSDRRMVKLVLKDRVDPVLMSDVVFHSASIAIPLPAVARLRKYVDLPPEMRSVLLTSKGVLARDEWICAYCGGHADTMDHVIPRALGGPHTWSNVTASCRRCNQRKKDKTLEELGWTLDRPCPTPKGVSAYLLQLKPEPEWRPFLQVA